MSAARNFRVRPLKSRVLADMTTYLLAKHVFLCMRGSDVVFLDLKEDKYLSMDVAKVRSVLDLPMTQTSPIKVDDASRAGGTQSLGDTARQKSAQALLKRGMLTIDHTAGKPVELASTEDPETDLIGIAAPIEPNMRFVDVVRFVIATLAAWAAMRFSSLEAVVSKVSERRLKHSNGPSAIDLDRAKRCMSLFERIRPYVFSARDRCLFESLVLSNFLAKYDLYPQWVFGVTTNPFAAHCWLQHRHVVFNDYAEHAREFTPLMII